jgi:hypothetical protein
MKLQGYREFYYFYTGKASDLSRQLGFAAIAIIWLFKKDVAGLPTLPRDLFLPGILVVSSLTLDLIQYCIGAAIWYFFYRSKEKAKVSEESELDHSVWLERPISILFVLKVGCVIVAYIYIFVFLMKFLLNMTN